MLLKVENFFAVKSRRKRLPKKIRERSEKMRRNGEKTKIPGEGDQKGRHSNAGHGREPGGTTT